MSFLLREYTKRAGLLLGGLLISAVGITMSLQANIGLEPWSVLQSGMSIFFGMTYGTATMIVGAVVVAVAIACGESFGAGTIANIFFCPYMVDFFLWLNCFPRQNTLLGGLLMLVLGMELLAIGTWMYMKSALGSGPRDALMVVLARKTGRSVGLCRATVEILAIIVGWLMGGQVGIGTVIAGVGVGSLFNLNFALLRFRAAELHQENLPETIRRFRNAEKES